MASNCFAARPSKPVYCQRFAVQQWFLQDRIIQLPVPSTIFCPLSIMSKRLAINCISLSRCDDTITVLLSWLLRCRIRFLMSAIPCGSRPLVGSSRIISLGSCASAMAIPSRCFMPWLKVSTLLKARSYKPTVCKCCISKSALILAAPLMRANKLKVFKSRQILVNVGLFNYGTNLLQRFLFYVFAG